MGGITDMERVVTVKENILTVCSRNEEKQNEEKKKSICSKLPKRNRINSVVSNLNKALTEMVPIFDQHTQIKLQI